MLDTTINQIKVYLNEENERNVWIITEKCERQIPSFKKIPSIVH